MKARGECKIYISTSSHRRRAVRTLYGTMGVLVGIEMGMRFTASLVCIALFVILLMAL